MIMHVIANRFFKNRHFQHLAFASLFYLGFISFLIASLDTKPIVPNATTQQQVAQQQAVADIELNQMVTWPLFGQGASKLHQIKDSNLQLVGIIFEGKESIAIIRVDGVEQILKNGSKINENYTVDKIEPMRVVVSTQDGLKQLQLFENIQNQTPPQAQNEANPYGQID